MDHQTPSESKKKACVTGGKGYVAPILIEHLLKKGYKVNTTVKDPDNEEELTHLRELQKQGDLTIFKADLEVEGSFDNSFSGCEYVFHVATIKDYVPNDPEGVVNSARQGVTNVLNSCLKKSVKRVIYTCSSLSVCINDLPGPGLVMTEANYSNFEFLRKKDNRCYAITKAEVQAEKAAWNFSLKNKIDLITVITPLIVGNYRYSDEDPRCDLFLATSLITGNEIYLNNLQKMQELCGSVSFCHVDDVARANLFLAEKEKAYGRYICCSHNTSVPWLINFIKRKYPRRRVFSEIGESCFRVTKLTLSSVKIIREGFQFEYEMEKMYDQMIDYLKSKGLIRD